MQNTKVSCTLIEYEIDSWPEMEKLTEKQRTNVVDIFTKKKLSMDIITIIKQYYYNLVVVDNYLNQFSTSNQIERTLYINNRIYSTYVEINEWHSKFCLLFELLYGWHRETDEESDISSIMYDYGWADYYMSKICTKCHNCISSRNIMFYSRNKQKCYIGISMYAMTKKNNKLRKFENDFFLNNMEGRRDIKYVYQDIEYKMQEIDVYNLCMTYKLYEYHDKRTNFMCKCFWSYYKDLMHRDVDK